MLNSESDLGSDVRIKRFGSLSIVNNLDVLRQRVMLELARRKALQDQRQVDENRRFLESIGKRSVSDADRIVRSGMKNSRERSAASRNEWIEENNPSFHGSQNDRTVRAYGMHFLRFSFSSWNCFKTIESVLNNFYRTISSSSGLYLEIDREKDLFNSNIVLMMMMSIFQVKSIELLK